MKNITRFYRQDSGSGGAPPPPPPPPPSDQNAPPPPPPPPPSGGSTGSSGGAGSNAIIALVVGILSLLFACGCSIIGVIGGIIAWMLGKKELAAIDAGTSSEAGRQMAKWGMWLGIASVILGAIFFVIGIIYYILNGSYMFYNF